MLLKGTHSKEAWRVVYILFLFSADADFFKKRNKVFGGEVASQFTACSRECPGSFWSPRGPSPYIKLALYAHLT